MKRKNQSDAQKTARALKIGQKIRFIRRSKNITLKQLSEATKLSVPLLSQIEKGILIPVIPTLLKISMALNLKIASFFHEEPMNEKKLVIVKPSERIPIKTRIPVHKAVNYRYESLAHTKVKKTMDPYFVTIGKHAEKNYRTYSHDGEEFIFILKGIVEFKSDDETYILHPGDSIYFESDIPHATRALGTGKAEALLVFSNP
jgi:transcriptional regulator with XRE-family HTH domain